jgi:hypothetical protein
LQEVYWHSDRLTHPNSGAIAIASISKSKVDKLKVFCNQATRQSDRIFVDVSSKDISLFANQDFSRFSSVFSFVWRIEIAF